MGANTNNAREVEITVPVTSIVIVNCIHYVTLLMIIISVTYDILVMIIFLYMCTLQFIPVPCLQHVEIVQARIRLGNRIANSF